MRKQWSAYLFLAPMLILFGVFTVSAVAYAFYLSFHEWNILEPEKPFVGLDNYAGCFTTSGSPDSIVNTVYYTAVSVPLTMGIGLAHRLAAQQSDPGPRLLPHPLLPAGGDPAGHRRHHLEVGLQR